MTGCLIDVLATLCSMIRVAVRDDCPIDVSGEELDTLLTCTYNLYHILTNREFSESIDLEAVKRTIDDVFDKVNKRCYL